MRACGIISKAMGDSWQAAMTYLERKHPGRWSRNERRELSGTLQVVPINLAAFTNEELKLAARLTAKAQGIEPPEEIAEGSEPLNSDRVSESGSPEEIAVGEPEAAATTPEG